MARGASQDEIRRAFRKLAKELHPDRNPGDKAAEERFKRVTAAFDVLGDEEKRKRFDRGEIDADGRETFGGGFGGFGGGRPGGGPGGRFEGVDLDEIFSVFGGGFGGQGARGGAGFAQRGSDVKARLEIDLEDSLKGSTRRIAFSDGRTLDVTIPKGADDGQVLRLKGQGQPGRGGPAGDALIELAIRPHPLYRRDGANLHMDLPVTVYDAVLGGKVAAPTPDGTVALNVPANAGGGTTLRLKGRGFVDKTGTRGDLFARITPVLPETPDPELQKFCEAWRERRPYVPVRK